ncbi:DNRLRE domain-containing protein, partial [Candidatus Dojkabacteria bacterium]|nr:DNRLRE domain-containing protein [Candidatus Dojkabacteria bacterium]
MTKIQFIWLFLITLSVITCPKNALAAENYIDITVWQDTYAPENPPYKGYYVKRDLTLGYSDENNEGKHRIYFKYLLPELAANSIELADITSVDLMLYQITNNELGTYIVKPYGVDTFKWFDDAITWATQPGLIDLEGTSEVTKTDEGNIAIDISDIIKSQLEKGQTDNGLALLMENEALPGGKFFSLECVYQLVEPLCTPEMRPRLRFYLSEDFIDIPTSTHQEIYTNNQDILIEWGDSLDREHLVEIYKDNKLEQLIYQS